MTQDSTKNFLNRAIGWLLQGTTTKTDAVGISITILVFAVAMAPLALSDADPYRIQAIISDIQKSFEKNNIISWFSDSSSNSEIYVEVEGKKVYVISASLQIDKPTPHLVPGLDEIVFSSTR